MMLFTKKETSAVILQQLFDLKDSMDAVEEKSKCESNNNTKLQFVETTMLSLKQAWKAHYTLKAENEQYSSQDSDAFKRNYMEFITSIFADELDDLRHGRIKDNKGDNKKKKKANTTDEDMIQQQNLKIPSNLINVETLQENDLKVLAHCLESGMEEWTEEEKKLLMEELEDAEKLTTKTTKMTTDTLHEQSRRKLFGN